MSSNARILLVDDEPIIRENYAELLRNSGFNVTAVANREGALRQFAATSADLALLDIDLGDEREGGFLICRELRQRCTQLPIIFLTSHDDEVDRISGLRLGADDYLTKDVSIRYLVVRIQTLIDRHSDLRRFSRGDEAVENELRRGHLEIDMVRLTAQWREQPLDLTLTQLWILVALVESPGKILSVAALMAAAQTQVAPNTITAHVTRIRRRFQAAEPHFNCIENVHGHGYRWIDHDDTD